MSEFITKGRVGGDVVKHEYDVQYTRQSYEVTNEGTEDMVLTAGYPFAAGVPVLNASINTVDGLLIQPVTIAPDETVKVAVLMHGPATINDDNLPTVDYEGTNLTMATFRTRIDAMSPKVVRKQEPDVQGEQET